MDLAEQVAPRRRGRRGRPRVQGVVRRHLLADVAEQRVPPIRRRSCLDTTHADRELPQAAAALARRGSAGNPDHLGIGRVGERHRGDPLEVLGEGPGNALEGIEPVARAGVPVGARDRARLRGARGGAVSGGGVLARPVRGVESGQSLASRSGELGGCQDQGGPVARARDGLAGPRDRGEGFLFRGGKPLRGGGRRRQQYGQDGQPGAESR